MRAPESLKVQRALVKRDRNLRCGWGQRWYSEVRSNECTFAAGPELTRLPLLGPSPTLDGSAVVRIHHTVLALPIRAANNLTVANDDVEHTI